MIPKMLREYANIFFQPNYTLLSTKTPDKNEVYRKMTFTILHDYVSLSHIIKVT